MATSREGQAGSLPGVDTLGRYRLLKKVAKGGMAEVYAARSYGAHGFEKTVAVKRILPKFSADEQFANMMVDEAKISVLLNHPNIAQVFELGEQDGDLFIVMEFVAGQSLSAVVKRMRELGERIPVLESCFIVVELLQGLHAAHSQRDATGAPAHIIHRDVSPQNCLISFDGHVKVIDFGIARARDRLEATEVGTIKGKLRYLAPEMIDPGRFTDDGDFDHRVDVFAAGIVLWELVAGRTLFAGDDEMKVYEAITDGKTPDLAAEGLCDPGLMQIIQHALERRLQGRYATAEAFADELRSYLYRTDPSFTHKRVAQIMDRLFATERDELVALERGAGGPPDGARKASGTGGPTSSPQLASRSMPQARTPTPSASARNNETQTLGLLAAAEAAGVGGRESSRSDVRRRQHEASAATAVVEAQELQPHDEGGDDLTVMTLVSREGVLRASDPDGVFSNSHDATRTASNDGVAPRKRSGSGRALEDTPHTRGHGTATRSPHRRRRGPGLWLGAAAGFGLLVALAIVTVVEVTEETATSALDAGALVATDPSTAVQPVRVIIRVPTVQTGAMVQCRGMEQPAPAVFEARPGELLEVLIKAPGASGKVDRILVPEDQVSDLIVDVALDWAAVPVVLTTQPADAEVRIDGKPVTVETRVAPGRRVVVEVSAPGFVPFKQDREVKRDSPLVIDVELKKKSGEKAVRAQTPLRGTGTLVLKSRPYWGQVSIDGKSYEETTPLTVELKVGSHDVVVAHPPKGLEKRFKVIIKANGIVDKTVTFN